MKQLFLLSLFCVSLHAMHIQSNQLYFSPENLARQELARQLALRSIKNLVVDARDLVMEKWQAVYWECLQENLVEAEKEADQYSLIFGHNKYTINIKTNNIKQISLK